MLLDFQILQELGFLEYTKGVALISGPDCEWYKLLEAEIQAYYTGPDSFWNPDGKAEDGCGRFFGNAWWVPFPPTLVFILPFGAFVLFY